MSAKEAAAKNQSKSVVNLVLLVIVAVLAIILFTSSVFSPPAGSTNDILSFSMLGAIGVLFIILILFRTMGRISVPQPSKTLTMLQCTKCAFKKIRDFQLGDYIPKSEGECPNCKGPFIIEEIYPEPKPKKGSKFPF
jgi:protein-S-isoprenylcysteine O-methyltransferase Ste14